MSRGLWNKENYIYLGKIRIPVWENTDISRFENVVKAYLSCAILETLFYVEEVIEIYCVELKLILTKIKLLVRK